ncbi:hypothetical protein CR513_56163, partial [Mucuna pruriens]
MLPYALHRYRTSILTSIGAIPYSLMYGTKAVLPVEVEIPSLRVLAEVELNDAEWVQSRLDQLNLIEEKWLTALCHWQLYQWRIKNAFDRKVWPCLFKEGDLVFRKMLPNAKDPRGKWTTNYEGPYLVKRAFSRGALVLADSEGQELKHLMRSNCSTLESSIEEESKGLTPRVSRMEELAPLSTRESIINLQLKALGRKTREGNTSAPSKSSTILTPDRDEIHVNRSPRSQVRHDNMKISKKRMHPNRH